MTDLFKPTPQRDLPMGRLQLRKEHLMSEIESSSRSRLRHPPRRLVVALTIVATAILSGAAYAGYVLMQSDTNYVATIDCNAATSGLGESIISLQPADKGSPTTACARTWLEQSSDSSWPHAATAARLAANPDRMLACSEKKTGVVWVFAPTDEGDTCADLGRPYGSEFVPFVEEHPNGVAQLDNYVQLRDELDAAFKGKCMSYDEAASVVRKALDKHGYTDGTVTPAWEQWPNSEGMRPRCAEWTFISDQPTNIFIAGRN
jgi:hypothetical protein